MAYDEFHFECGCRDHIHHRPRVTVRAPSMHVAEERLRALGWVGIEADDLMSCSPECWNRYQQAIFAGWACSCPPQWHTVEHPARGTLRLLDGFAHLGTCAQRRATGGGS